MSSMVVAHNIKAVNTQKNLYGTNLNITGNIQRLSSGYRINQGQDGPADLVISELLRAQKSGIERVIRNSTESMNVLSIAEGALNEMNDILKKMKQLALHAANGTTSSDQIRADQAEVDSGISTINRIANTTRYSNQQLLNGAMGITFNNRVSEGSNKLLDARYARIDQLASRNKEVSITYSGLDAANRAANMAVQARRAYFEAVGDNRNMTVMTSDKSIDSLGGTFFTGVNSGYTNQIRANERNYETGDDINAFFNYNFGNKFEVGKNTDAEGKLYFKVEANSNGDALIKAYSSSGVNDETKLVATATVAAGAAAAPKDQLIFFKEVNGSGINGTVRTNTTAESMISGLKNKVVSYRVTDPDFDSTNGKLLQDQALIFTGLTGSQQINLGKGMDVGEIAKQINDVSLSTGISAAVILGQNALSNIDSDTLARYTDGGLGLTLGTAAAGKPIVSISGTQAGVNSNSVGMVFLKISATTSSATSGVAGDTGVASFSVSLNSKSDGTGIDLGTITFTSSLTSISNGGADTVDMATVRSNGTIGGANGASASYDSTGATWTLNFNVNGLKASIVIADATVDVTTLDPTAVANTITIASANVADHWDFSNKDGQDTLVRGFNTDINGQLYVQVLDDPANTGAKAFVNIYKDAAMTQLVAQSDVFDYDATTGTAVSSTGGRITFHEMNRSGLEGSFEYAMLDANAPATAGFDVADVAKFTVSTQIVSKFDISGPGVNNGNIASAQLNGINIGLKTDNSRNTDESGYIYVKTDKLANGNYKLTFYRDSDMKEAVAETWTSNGQGYAAGSMNVEVRELNNSGLNGKINLSNTMDVTNGGKFTMRAEVGLRVYANEYGSKQWVEVQNTGGNLLDYYNDATGDWTEVELDSRIRVEGADASLMIDGTRISTLGLIANISTQNLTAEFTFNAGDMVKYFNQFGGLSSFGTTIAQIGYGSGMASSRAGQLQNSKNLFVNAGSSNTQTLYNFKGGMDLQLGDQVNAQDRTIIGVNSMTGANLGLVTFTDDFDPTTPGYETKTLSLEDLQSGKLASLANDPQKALAVIEQAIKDVSNQRARLGATQANLLQTNINNLQVAYENITKTESYIRDTDYATETTDFAKNQIMLQAGTSMLAQANMQTQIVLSLLQ